MFQGVSCDDILKLWREIGACKRQLDSAKEPSALLQLELSALKAEFALRLACVRYESNAQFISYAYAEASRYHDLRSKADIDDYLRDAAGDLEDFHDACAVVQTTEDGSRSSRYLNEKAADVQKAEQEYDSRLESWIAAHDEERNAQLSIHPVIAISVEDGRLTVRRELSDGSWAYAGPWCLPSGLYVIRQDTWSDVLAEFEELINNDLAQESDLQRFLERHPELLMGNDYDTAIPQAAICFDSNKWAADFILKPIDQLGFCKILELKLPKARIQRNHKSGHPRFYAELFRALGQLKDYAAAFNEASVRDRFAEQYGIQVLYPRAQLIIGRRKDIIHSGSLKFLQSQTQIEITDWDTTLDQVKRRFQRI